MSTIVVNTVSDTVNANDGVTSLREAIAQAGAGDTITFSAALNHQTILVASELDITKSLTIDGDLTRWSRTSRLSQTSAPFLRRCALPRRYTTAVEASRRRQWRAVKQRVNAPAIRQVIIGEKRRGGGAGGSGRAASRRAIYNEGVPRCAMSSSRTIASSMATAGLRAAAAMEATAEARSPVSTSAVALFLRRKVAAAAMAARAGTAAAAAADRAVAASSVRNPFAQ